MDHKQLMKSIPGTKSVTFLPLYDYVEDGLMAGCFLWTSVAGLTMTLDVDLSFLHAFGNSVTSEVARIDAQKNEAAKATFIASMSHELRSPMHGILGATEFLIDTATDAYQSGLITSVMTCGKTLLDMLSHVLDYSKINKLGRMQMRRNAEQDKSVNLASDWDSMHSTAEVDLGVLAEEAMEAVTAGHAFKKQHGPALTAKLEKSTRSSSVVVRKSGLANKTLSEEVGGTVVGAVGHQPTALVAGTNSARCAPQDHHKPRRQRAQTHSWRLRRHLPPCARECEQLEDRRLRPHRGRQKRDLGRLHAGPVARSFQSGGFVPAGHRSGVEHREADC